MKTKLTLFVAVLGIALLVAGCSTPANSNSAIIINDVIGEYEFKDPAREGVSWRFVFHENGSLQRWANDTLQPPGVWKIEDGKIRISWKNGTTGIWTRQMLETRRAVINTLDVPGTYEWKNPSEQSVRVIFHKNGSFQSWKDGKPYLPGSWKIEDGELHVMLVSANEGEKTETWTRHKLESRRVD